jgi:hypothetical protein
MDTGNYFDRFCLIFHKSNAFVSVVPNKVKNVKTGVMVKVNPSNSKKIVRITEKTHRTFAAEVNVGVEQYADKQIHKYKDDGK